MNQLAFVIINYNDAPATLRLMDNIRPYQNLTEIVVVDNHSTDDSYSQLKSGASGAITVLRTEANRGYSAGMNCAARYLLEKYDDINIIFSNSDIRVAAEQDLTTLNSRIADDVVVVGPVIDEHGTRHRGWRLSTPGQEVLYNIPHFHLRFKQRWLYYPESHFSGLVSPVDAVYGCFFLISGAFLRQIGGFDETVFLFYEENILACQVKAAGKQEVIDNTVTVFHDHSGTIDKNIRRVRKLQSLKKSQHYYVRHYLKASAGQMLLLDLTAQLEILGVKTAVALKRS